MSTRRRVSTFTPPVIALTETNGKSAAEHPSASFVLPPVKRRFSQDENIVPVKVNSTAEDFDVVNVLSSGNFADVILVRRRDADRVMVAKAYGHGSWRSEYLCSAELRILQNVNSPWIVTFLGYIQDFEEDFLLLEYLPNGNLLKVVKNKAERLSEIQTKFYAAEMFLAVDALHEEGFMHRNVQISNFLVHTSGHLRICDFGLSYQFRPTDALKKGAKPQLITSPVYASSDTGTSLSKRGSIEVQSECSTAYLAPEVLRLLLPKPFFWLLKPKVGYSFLCDYWSLGVAIYHMLYGYLPFRPDSKGCILDKVLAYRKYLSFSPEDGPPPGTVGVDIVRALLTKESKRLGNSSGFTEVKNHPFFEYVAWNRLGHGKVSLPAKEADVARYMSCASSSATPGTSKGKRMTKQKAAPPLAVSATDDSRASSSDGEYRQQLELLDADFHIPVSQDHSVRVGGWSIVDNPSSSVFIHDTVPFPKAVFARSSQPRQGSLSLLLRNSHKCSTQDSHTQCVTKVVNVFEESSVDLNLQPPVD